MKIQQFGGGQSSRLRPQFIGQNEGVSYINIDNSLGSLAPVKDKLATAIAVEQYHKFFNAEQIWVDSTVPTDFLEYQQTMYSVDGVQPKKLKNGVSLNLGIVAPIAEPTVINTYSIEPVTDFSIENLVSDASAYGDLPLSDLRYRVVNTFLGFGDSYTSRVVDVLVKKGTTSVVRTSSSILSAAQAALPVSSAIIEDATDVGFSRSILFDDPKGPIAYSVKFYRYYKGVWRYVTAILGTGPNVPALDDVEDISANEELDLTLIGPFSGTYQYVYTYYNADDGTESAPSPLSVEVEAESGRTDITGMSVSPDPQVTHKRLYRVGGDITEFSLVITLDKDVTDYNDNLGDTEIDGRLLSSDNYYEAPTELRYLAESYAMLFGAVGDQLRFTPIGQPNAWPPEYSIAFDAEIMGIGAVANGVIVCTEYKTYLVTGTGPLSLSQQSLSGDQGCISHASMQEIGTALIWASAEGLCTTSGNNVTNITKDKLGKIILDPVDSVIDDEVYYCHNADGTTLAWDFRFGNIPKYLDLGVSQVAVANSELYGWSAGLLYKLFQGASNLEMTYLSPRFIEGTVTELKAYKKFHIYVKGDIIINILINDIIVFTKQLTGEDDFQLQVPQDKQRGNFIQVSITGTGEVYEYEYEAGRENG